MFYVLHHPSQARILPHLSIRRFFERRHSVEDAWEGGDLMAGTVSRSTDGRRRARGKEDSVRQRLPRSLAPWHTLPFMNREVRPAGMRTDVIICVLVPYLRSRSWRSLCCAFLALRDAGKGQFGSFLKGSLLGVENLHVALCRYSGLLQPSTGQCPDGGRGRGCRCGTTERVRGSGGRHVSR